MAFKLRYQMTSGTALRIVDTADEAIAACAAIEEAGGRTTSIVDQQGENYSLEDLRALADTASMPSRAAARPRRLAGR